MLVKSNCKHRSGSLSPFPCCMCVQLASLRFASQCEHHMLPFFGEARVLIVMQLSAPPLAPGTLEALLNTSSQRLQIQERLTQELVSAVHSLTGAMLSSPACKARDCCWSLPACACAIRAAERGVSGNKVADVRRQSCAYMLHTG